MDSFDVKVEKADAILRYRRLRKITTLFRFMELCLFLIMISSFSTQFPIAFKLSSTLFSPWFVFVVGNAIIVILFLKSGQGSAQENTNNNSRIDLFNEYVENCEKKQRKQGKQGMCEEESGDTSDVDSFNERNIHRSSSENLRSDNYGESVPKLRRSVTETCRESVNYSGKSPVNSYAEDHMSSEEFRRKVETFIARQQKSLREEEFSGIASLGE